MAIERTEPRPETPNLEKTTHFLKEVQTELQKTTWPTREEALHLTRVVIGVIAILGLYMFGLDVILNAVIGRLIHH